MSENEDKNEKKEESETEISEEENKTSNNADAQEETKVKKKKKYVFNCTKCGQCCEKREFVPVSFKDIQNWTKTGTINAVFPNLKIRAFQTTIGEEKQSQEYLTLVLAGSEEGCSMFDKENKLCNIYHSMPLECKAFPLGYDGKNYFVKDRTVPGLGKGTMTKERLIEDRDNARADFESRLETQLMLPLIYSLFMQNLMEQQQKVMEDMPEDKRKQLDELLKSTTKKTK
ncbi:MAG: YkgJ family cysteine cluster protein [Candidatus Hodarchaeota archaeon]